MAKFRTAKRSHTRVLNYINTDASAVVAQQGQTVTIPLYPTSSSSLVTDGNALVSDDSVGSSVSITLNKHRAVKFSLTQVAQALDGNKVVDGLLEGRIAGILNDIEADVMSVVTSGFTTNTVGTYNNAITEANAASAIGKLYESKIPEGFIPTALVRHDANAWQALVQIAEFADAQNTGEVSEVGKETYGRGKIWHGARWFMSQSMPKSGTSIDNAIFHPNAICAAFRAFETPMAPGVQAIPMVMDGVPLQMLLQWNGDRLADEVVIHSLYGYGVGKEDWGCLFKS